MFRLTLDGCTEALRGFSAALIAAAAVNLVSGQCFVMGTLAERVRQAKLHPRRLSVTLNNRAWEDVHRIATNQGRSASNLAAFLIERGIQSFVDQLQA